MIPEFLITLFNTVILVGLVFLVYKLSKFLVKKAFSKKTDKS
ncbi:hypothetical protein [Peptostreptococcus faecalis]|nr:hypothetical protein [Peptostreptococcus faecalis]